MMKIFIGEIRSNPNNSHLKNADVYMLATTMFTIQKERADLYYEMIKYHIGFFKYVFSILVWYLIISSIL